MSIKAVEVPVISDALRRVGVPLSAAVKANGFIFVSGAPPIDPQTGALVKGDVAAQTEVVLRNLSHVLTAAGSSLDKVVKMTVYSANSAYFNTINEVYRKYFPENPPARTFVTVGSWPMEFDVEIECIALE